ncbi:MAG: hypothetical protein Q9173_005640 [Seirophora scorigena]
MPAETVKSIANPSIIERYLVHPKLPSLRLSQVSNDLDLVWSIKWPDQLSKYNGDLGNYIWRPHALVMFSSTRLLQTFKKQFTSELPVFSSMTAHLIVLLHMIHAVFRVALSETRDFMQDARQQVFDMTLESLNDGSEEARLLEKLAGEVKEDLEYAEKE